MTHPIKRLKPHELKILSLIIELQSQEINVKNILSALEESRIMLPPEIKNKALILASFVRIVHPLDKSDWKFLPGRIKQVTEAV